MRPYITQEDHSDRVGFSDVLKKGIIFKLGPEMTRYNMTPTIEDDVLTKIDLFLVEWFVKYAQFFKETFCFESLIATYNILPKKNQAREYIMDKISSATTVLTARVYNEKINRKYSFLEMIVYSNYSFNDDLNCLVVPFSPPLVKRIMLNEGITEWSEMELCLVSVAVGSILDLLLYIIFHSTPSFDRSEGISMADVEYAINMLTSLLYADSDEIAQQREEVERADDGNE